MKPDIPTLRAQLAELNSRSRWYSTRLWQIPFAYIGLSGIIISSLVKLDSVNIRLIGIALILLGIIGVLVTGHVFGVRKAEVISIKKLQYVEEELKIQPKVRARDESWDVRFMVILVILSTLLFVASGTYFVWGESAMIISVIFSAVVILFFGLVT